MIRRAFVALITFSLLLASGSAMAEGVGTLPFSRLGKVGLVGSAGETLLSAKYEQIVPLPITNDAGETVGQSKLFRAAKKTGDGTRYALYSAAGKPLTDFVFTSLTCVGDRIFGEGGRNSQMFSENGKLLFPVQYDHVVYSEGILSAYNKTGRGVCIDKNGTRLTDPVFQEVGAFSGGLARVVIDGKVGFIDATMSMAIEAKYAPECVGSFSTDGRAALYDGDLWGLIDREGNWAEQPRYDALRLIAANRFSATTAQGTALLDGKGAPLTAFTYASITPAARGYFAASGRLLDASGNEIKTPGDAASATLTPIAKNRFLVSSKSRVGISNEKGAWLTDANIATVEAFEQSEYVRFTRKDAKRYGLLSTDGKVVLDPEYEILEPSYGEYWSAQRGDEIGVLSVSSGDWVVCLEQ